MKIKYFNAFHKRVNSTQQPIGGVEVEVRLKEPCSIASPVFICVGVPDDTTYVYVETWNRYYFVSDVVHNGNLVEISCTSDSMATFKTQIGGLYANIEYAASSTNTDILDPRNKPTFVSDVKTTQVGSLGSFGSGVTFQAGYNYVVGVISDEGLNYYLMGSTDLEAFTKYMFDQDFFRAIENQFFDVKSCLVSCIAIPIVKSADLYTNQYISFNGDRVSYNGVPIQFGKITSRVRSYNPGAKSITFPSDSWGYDYSYLDMPPYTTGSIYLPFVGVVDFDCELFAQNKSITVKAYLDIVTGDIVYQLLRGSVVVSTYSGNCAAGVPVAGQSYNAIGAAQGLIATFGGAATMIGGAVTENPIMAMSGLGAAVGGGISSVSSMQRHTQINGANSSMIGSWLGYGIDITIISRRPSEMLIDYGFKNVSGMPYFKGDTIGNLTGYIKCNGASIDIAGYDSDRSTINSYLNSGFYYE